jgi:hypothetical protein
MPELAMVSSRNICVRFGLLAAGITKSPSHGDF